MELSKQSENAGIQELRSSLGFLVNGLGRLMRNALETELQGTGMGATVWTVLMALGEEDGQPQNDLSKRTFLDGATITRALDILEARIFIERRRDNTDRRVQIVTLTEAGRRAYHETSPMGRRVNDEVASQLRSEERRVLEANMRDMIDRLHQVNNSEEDNGR